MSYEHGLMETQAFMSILPRKQGGARKLVQASLNELPQRLELTPISSRPLLRQDETRGDAKPRLGTIRCAV